MYYCSIPESGAYLQVVVGEHFGVLSTCSKIQETYLETEGGIQHEDTGMRHETEEEEEEETDSVVVWVVEKVAPVWVSLHEPELKQFSHHQIQHSGRYLCGERGGNEKTDTLVNMNSRGLSKTLILRGICL